MELDEEDAKICRLCGQRENIYIDVFGEEGIKRFLGHKIQTKINILIEESDPLPKAICVQCLGKLEFVCDFQEECLRTQELLREQYILPTLSHITKSDTKAQDKDTETASTSSTNYIGDKLNFEEVESKNETKPSRLLRNNATKIQRLSPRGKRTLSSDEKDEIIPLNNEDNNCIINKYEETNDQVPVVVTRRLRSRQSITIEDPSKKRNRNSRNNINNNNNNHSRSLYNDDKSTTKFSKTTVSNTDTTTSTFEPSQKENNQVNNTESNGVINNKKKPEELYKLDGEEVRVDDNIEQSVIDNKSSYSCKLCRKFYERKDKCTVHVKTHLGIKQYTCILCNAKFVCKSDVMKHIRCSHTNPRPIQCPKCPKRFKSKFYLTEHDNVHKGIRPYTCDSCGQSYHHKVSLQIHMKSHLPPQNLACEYCGKVFPYRTRLLSHIASVHLKNKRNFRCRFCYNLYSSLAVLNDHIKLRHATTFTCEVCSKTFKVAAKYKAHVLQHSNPKPFVCNVCNNRYASKAFLNEHLLKHEGLRKHVCQKCGASFAQASHLAAHRHVHGEKIHVCPECGKKFNRRDNMKVHSKRHSLPNHVQNSMKKIFNGDRNTNNEN